MHAGPTQIPVLLAAILLCGCSPDGIQDLEASLSTEVSTVVELSWRTEDPGYAWVEFGLDEQRQRSTPIVEGTDGQHSAQLLGLPALSTVYYEVITETDRTVHRQQGELATGGHPAGLPDLIATTHDEAALSPEPYLLMGLVGAESFVVMVDRSGEVLWCLPAPQAEDGVVPTTAAWDPQGPGLLVGEFLVDSLALVSEPEPTHSQAVYLDLGGTERDRTDLGVAHHDLVQLPDGTLATIGADVRDWVDPEQDDQIRVLGDAIVLIPPQGEAEVIFSTWDWAEPEAHARFYEIGPSYGDWTHGNGLAYHADRDSFLLSLGMLDTVLEVSRSTGEVLREFGPGGWAVQDGLAFTFQHDPHWTEEGTLLMSSLVGHDSRVMAVEYQPDEEVEALSYVWSYGANEEYTSVAGGEAIRTANGNTLLNTGYHGLLVEVTPEREPVWELSSSMGHVMVSVSPFEDFYGP